MKEDWFLGGIVIAVVLVTVILFSIMVSNTRRIGTSMVYRGETVVLVALQHDTTPLCYVVRRGDGSTMLVPINEMTLVSEKP